MRAYGQFCALAKALDVVGDRWTLLIVRELSIRPCRYTDLRDGLPGIATNLLADRLRSLEAAGIICAESAPPPVATTLYRLSARGEELVPITTSLARWGSPYLAERQPADEFRPRWLVVAVRAVLGDVHEADLPPLAVELDVDDEPIAIRVEGGVIRTELGRVVKPDLAIRCDAMTALGLLTGGIGLDDAVVGGVAEARGGARSRQRFARLVDSARPPVP